MISESSEKAKSVKGLDKAAISNKKTGNDRYNLVASLNL